MLWRQVRYLQAGRYKQHSGTWYADNFKAAVARPDAVTFDASPTTFGNIALAPDWINKWLPQAGGIFNTSTHDHDDHHLLLQPPPSYPPPPVLSSTSSTSLQHLLHLLHLLHTSSTNLLHLQTARPST